MLKKLVAFVPNLVPVLIALAIGMVNVLFIGVRMTINAAWDGKITNEERTMIEIETWSPVWAVLRKVPFITIEK